MESPLPPNETPSGSMPASFVHAIRSDELPQMVEVLRQIELFRDYATLFQVDVILDANVVLRDLMWLSRKRKYPRGRPEVLELLECKTVRAHAPTFLIQEIESKIPKLAQQHRIPEGILREHWEHYRLRITFVDVGGPSRGRKVRDRKDTPYIRLQRKLEFPIASHDRDIAAMGGKVLRMQVFGSLKMYSRNTAVEFHLKVTGVGSAFALFGLANLFSQGTKSLTTQIGKLPKPVLWLAVALMAIALLHPESRKRIFAMIDRLMSGTAATLEFAFSALQPVFTEHYSAKEKAALGLAEAKTLLSSLDSDGPKARSSGAVTS
jgi:predicted nucleic acid-binding protein